MFYEEIKTKQDLSYLSVCLLSILYNSNFILMETSLGTNNVVVTRVHCINFMHSVGKTALQICRNRKGPDQFAYQYVNEKTVQNLRCMQYTIQGVVFIQSVFTCVCVCACMLPVHMLLYICYCVYVTVHIRLKRGPVIYTDMRALYDIRGHLYNYENKTIQIY